MITTKNPSAETDIPGIDPLGEQIGGVHYKLCRIQPVEYIFKNNLDWFQGTVVKYVTRWKTKGGVTDLKKARHVLDLYLQLLEQDGVHDGTKTQ
jgi:hypothetical protein